MFCALMAEQVIFNANVAMGDEFLPEGLMTWKVERSCEGEGSFIYKHRWLTSRKAYSSCLRPLCLPVELLYASMDWNVGASENPVVEHGIRRIHVKALHFTLVVIIIAIWFKRSMAPRVHKMMDRCHRLTLRGCDWQIPAFCTAEWVKT